MAERLISLFPWRFPRRFGFLEVAMYTAGGSLDFVRRHMTIVNELEQLRRGSRLAKLDVLDFGGGHSPLSTFLRLYGLRANYRVTVADVSAEAIGAAQLASPLVAKELLSQEGSLPFPAGKFDVVVSSDVFEHIPRGFREHWAGELKRVSRIGQIHNVPCDGELFASSSADSEFQAWHIRQFGTAEPWTAEHLENGAPAVDELRALFPGCEVRGLANVDAWSAVMKAEAAESSAIARLRRGLSYARSGRRRDQSPPFKAAFLTCREP